MMIMKKILLVFGLFTLGLTMSGANDLAGYFTVGENDTVMIPRSALGEDISVRVGAQFSVIIGRWTINLSYPAGLIPLSVSNGEALSVDYLNDQGEPCVYTASLIANNEISSLSCYILVNAYYYNSSGILSPCGTAKWMPGDYDEMFTLNLHVADDFEGGSINYNGILASDYDPRGLNAYGGAMTFGAFTFVISDLKGDVNRDGVVNITDVTTLISAVITDDYSGIKIDDADMNGDGEVNITDVTMLINLVMSE